MSTTMPDSWWEQSSQQFVEDLGLLLVTLTHADLLEPVRVASNLTDVVSRGQTFVAWPLMPRLPSSGETAKRGGLRIANVDRAIGRTVLSLKGRIACSFEIVSRADPDDVLYDHHGLYLTGIRTEGPWIVADAVGQGSHGKAFPKSSANPEVAPGTFVA